MTKSNEFVSEDKVNDIIDLMKQFSHNPGVQDALAMKGLQIATIALERFLEAERFHRLLQMLQDKS